MDTRPTASTPAFAAANRERAWFGPMTTQVLAFLAHLRRIPLSMWRRSIATDLHAPVEPYGTMPPPALRMLQEEAADQRARSHLREALESMPGVVHRIRQTIDGELPIPSSVIPPAAVVRMRRAARLAACAIAARELLSPADFSRLYRPFADLIPSHVLAAG